VIVYFKENKQVQTLVLVTTYHLCLKWRLIYQFTFYLLPMNSLKLYKTFHVDWGCPFPSGYTCVWLFYFV